MDNEQLKLTDFLDPIVQMAIGLSLFADILFIIIPIRYIFAVIVAMVLWSGMRGFATKLIFVIALVLPLPLMTVGSILAVLLSNSFIRFLAVQLGIAVLTGGVGTLAEAGAFLAETTAKLAATKVAQEVAETAGGEGAGKLAGAATGVVMGKGSTGAEAGAKAGAAEAGVVSKGPAAQPAEIKGPQAQPEKPKTLGERTKERVIKHLEKERDELSREIAGEKTPVEEQEEEPNVVEGEFGNPDIGNLDAESIEDKDDGTVDLRKAA